MLYETHDVVLLGSFDEGGVVGQFLGGRFSE